MVPLCVNDKCHDGRVGRQTLTKRLLLPPRGLQTLTITSQTLTTRTHGNLNPRAAGRRPITALPGCPPPWAAPSDVPGVNGSPVCRYFPGLSLFKPIFIRSKTRTKHLEFRPNTYVKHLDSGRNTYQTLPKWSYVPPCSSVLEAASPRYLTHVSSARARRDPIARDSAGN